MRIAPLAVLLAAACTTQKEADALQALLDASFVINTPAVTSNCDENPLTLDGAIDARYANTTLDAMLTVDGTAHEVSLEIDGDGAWSIPIDAFVSCPLASAEDCVLTLDLLVTTTDEVRGELLQSAESTTVTITSDAQPAFIDADGDGSGDQSAAAEPFCALPNGYATSNDDCDDADDAIAPGADEVCDGVDNDCDDDVDEGLPSNDWFPDADDDGFGDGAAAPTTTCDAAAPAGFVADNTDCDDTTAERYPGFAEVCDGLDNDCAAGVDDGLTFVDYYPDLDTDGFGDRDATAVSRCDGAPPVHVTDNTDCDDTTNARNPGLPEVCDNGIDNDCDGQADDDDLQGVPGSPEYYLDRDNDGAYSGPVGQCATPMVPFVTVAPPTQDCDDTNTALNLADADGDAVTTCAGDCDDADDTIAPGLSDVTGDDVDQDCDGALLCYADDDRDGFGDPSARDLVGPTCASPADRVSANADDCDDSAADTYPGALELVADDIDQDCDAFDACYADADGDSYGSTTVLDLGVAVSAETCTTGVGVSANSLDCDDAEASISPEGEEFPGDDVDGNCDTFDSCYVDLDDDGFGRDDVESMAVLVSAGETCETAFGYASIDLDCDDADANVSPMGIELAGDAVDQDCDQSLACFADTDGDTYGSTNLVPIGIALGGCDVAGASPVDDDCADNNAAAFPGATELVANGVDEDCDTFDACYVDRDADGFGATQVTLAAVMLPGSCDTTGGFSNTSDDCDDASDLAFPGALELTCDGAIQDCLRSHDAVVFDGSGAFVDGTPGEQLAAMLATNEDSLQLCGDDDFVGNFLVDQDVTLTWAGGAGALTPENTTSVLTIGGSLVSVELIDLTFDWTLAAPATTDGSLLFIGGSQAEVTLDAVTFVNGDTTRSGGAIFVSAGSDLTVIGGSCVGNNAAAEGGCIQTLGRVDATSWTLTDNAAEIGGAMAVGNVSTPGSLDFADGTCSRNDATRGGCISVRSTSSSTLTNTTMVADSCSTTGHLAFVEGIGPADLTLVDGLYSRVGAACGSVDFAAAGLLSWTNGDSFISATVGNTTGAVCDPLLDSSVSATGCM
jgi:hypothetical protein